MPRWNTVAIIGVGLIGGSIGLALRKRGLANEVVGIGRPQSSRNLRDAQDCGAVTTIALDIKQGVANSDLIVVCTPVSEIADHLLLAAAAAPAQSLLTDAGSTKAVIIEKVEVSLPSGKRFIGSHPLAGSEKRGVQFARADLFEGRIAIITPTNLTAADCVSEATEFWTALGATVISMSPQAHDKALANTSHLPHVVASALAGNTIPGEFRVIGPGWRDVTRIAAGDPELWVQILLENRTNVLKSLSGFEKTVAEFRAALVGGDAATLRKLLTEGKKVRDAVGD